jgi:hypothetical protein
MVIGFTTTCAISAYHLITTKVVRYTPVFYTNKTDRHDITEILLKVAFLAPLTTSTYLSYKQSFVVKQSTALKLNSVSGAPEFTSGV